MRGAEFHGNTRRDSTTRILSTGPTSHVMAIQSISSQCPKLYTAMYHIKSYLGLLPILSSFYFYYYYYLFNFFFKR